MQCRYLDGESVSINNATLKKMIGTRVYYVLHRDIDRTGRGYWRKQVGTIERVHGRNVSLDDEWLYFSQIMEMCVAPDSNSD